MEGGRNNMANISESTAETQESQQEGINIDELTPDQAFTFITNAVRSQPFTYVEHVQLEQARSAVGIAIGLQEPPAAPQSVQV